MSIIEKIFSIICSSDISNNQFLNTNSFTAVKACINGCIRTSPKQIFLKTFPIFSWLSTYNKDFIFGDVISGCTVAVMHIPQGMGYALLAELPPVVGINMVWKSSYEIDNLSRPSFRLSFPF
jgi:hypothetical protein